jgi:hypothetical protein
MAVAAAGRWSAAVSRTGTRGALAQAAWSLWITVAGLLLIAGLARCTALQPPTEPHQCTTLALAEIEAAYVADVMALCGGKYTADECDALPERKALRERFDAARDAWAKAPECLQ